MAQVNKTIVYGGLAVVALAAYFTLGEDTAANTATSTKKKKKPPVSKNAVVFLPEDYKASFPALNEPMKNAFKPLVARNTELDRLPNDWGVPVGEPDWVYTGMADIDSVPTALLENTRTGDGVFLKQGESWKGVKIHRITPEELSVTLADGVVRRVKINAPALDQPILATPQGGFQPVNPPLRGPIGRGLAVRPDGSEQPVRGNANARRTAPGVDEGMGIGDEN